MKVFLHSQLEARGQVGFVPKSIPNPSSDLHMKTIYTQRKQIRCFQYKVLRALSFHLGGGGEGGLPALIVS